MSFVIAQLKRLKCTTVAWSGRKILAASQLKESMDVVIHAEEDSFTVITNPGLFSLLYFPGNNFPPQDYLFRASQLSGLCLIPGTRQESKVEGQPVAGFQKEYNTLVPIGWNLVPEPLRWVFILGSNKKGRPDIQWRGFRLYHRTQS